MFFRNSAPVRALISDILDQFTRQQAPCDPHERSDMFMLNRRLVAGGCDWRPSNSSGVWRAFCAKLNITAALFTDAVCRGSGCCGADPWNVSRQAHVNACRQANVTVVHARNGYERRMCEAPPSTAGRQVVPSAP